MNTTKQSLDDFVKHYLVAALWSETNDNGENNPLPLDDNYSLEDISSLTYLKCKNDCQAFLKKAENNCPENLLEEFYAFDYELMGHNFLLTRNYHGAGFWDGDHCSKELGKYLTEICHNFFKEVYFYVGDDNKVYCS